MKGIKIKMPTLTPIYLLSLMLASANAEVNIITKSQWNGKEASADMTKLELPVGRVIIVHTATADCDSQSTCSQRLQMIQEFHMITSHFDDIAYNFLIGNDGNVYEGRGWDNQGAFARGFNAGSLGIAFIGTYNVATPSDAALQSAQSLLESGIQLGKLREDYKLFGHRQLASTESPGSALYDIIKKWPHWSRSL